ncbi:hypothetical protein PV379_05360 [Streptomyces caniscabiei]|nr:hypothetical protein [Streptomyces caniscabiei]MDX2599644.1 hypothetical protein [Streptomyces caniscabiei]MDX2735061.1 hypothetical protein [Streptomyces caniscabiei]MDX2776757.1 hypothetical protein [Streptomyces caniscabiei]
MNATEALAPAQSVPRSPRHVSAGATPRTSSGGSFAQCRTVGGPDLPS